MLNFLKEIIKEKKKTDKYEWTIKDQFPYVKGKSNLNNSKCEHKRRIMSLLMRGYRLSALQYSDEYKTTKFSARLSELRNDYGFNIQDIWITPASGKKYKEYYFNINEVV